jgi:hypothetical protein
MTSDEDETRWRPDSTRSSTWGWISAGSDHQILKTMTISDYLLNIFLVGLVVLQIRGHKITRARLVFPVVVTVYVASQFLHGIPTAGNDVSLETSFAVAGATLGLLAGLATSVRRQGTGAFAKAGTVAAAFWVAGIGARMGFYLWVSHGGRSSVASFSAAHDITTGTAWVAGFILMAMLEVGVRTGILYAKTVRSGAEIPRGGLRQHLVTA